MLDFREVLRLVGFWSLLEGAGDLSKLVISRVIIRVTPFRALITVRIAYLLSPLPLQVGLGLRGLGLGP